MLTTRRLCFICFMLYVGAGFAQVAEISGLVTSSVEVENIHVMNKAEQSFTITNAKGEFTIKAKLNDTIQFSSVQHQLKYVVVDKKAMLFKVVSQALKIG